MFASDLLASKGAAVPSDCGGERIDDRKGIVVDKAKPDSVCDVGTAPSGAELACDLCDAERLPAFARL